MENFERSLFEGWMNGRRSLSIIALLGPVSVTAFCHIVGLTDDRVTLSLGTARLDLIDFLLDGWNFSLTAVPPGTVVMGQQVESSLSGVREGMSLTVFLLAKS
jgi:hypothetical protein